MMYMNMLTGEVTFSHNEAVEMYRTGAEIALLRWNEKQGEYIERVKWVH